MQAPGVVCVQWPRGVGWSRQGGDGVKVAVKTVELEAELIDTVCSRVRERLPNEQVAPCESFVRQYYHWVPPEDLADRSPIDLYGAAVAHWNLAQQRSPGTAKVHVYNPDFEQHGWQSPHTVVEIVSDDMPFLVDSINDGAVQARLLDSISSSIR